jgi:hypothetical protein
MLAQKEAQSKQQMQQKLYRDQQELKFKFDKDMEQL